MIFRPVLFAAGLIALAACAQDRGILLEEDQLARMIARERSFEWVGHGFSGDLTLTKNGSAFLKVDGAGADDGRWEQDGRLLCVQFKRAIQGAKRCAEVVRLPDGTYEARRQGSTVRFGVFSGNRDK